MPQLLAVIHRATGEGELRRNGSGLSLYENQQGAVLSGLRSSNRIGRSNWSDNAGALHGDLMEIIIYSRALDGAELQQLEQDLMQFHSVTP